MVKIITADMLRKKRACASQLRVFKTRFPNGVEVSEALARELASVFDWGWAAEQLLTSSAWEAYDEATAPARKAYDEATASARKAYNEAMAQAFARAYLADDQA